MRYEAKHNYLKKLARSIGNFINIAWTVAIRHQQWQCYKWLDGEALGQEQPDIGPGMYHQITQKMRYSFIHVHPRHVLSVYRGTCCTWRCPK